jgi:hypothetical protein
VGRASRLRESNGSTLPSRAEGFAHSRNRAVCGKVDLISPL